MAYKLIDVRSNTLTDGLEVTAILDTTDDLNDLMMNETNLSPGSIAIVAGIGLPAYLLNASGQWIKISDVP